MWYLQFSSVVFCNFLHKLVIIFMYIFVIYLYSFVFVKNYFLIAFNETKPKNFLLTNLMCPSSPFKILNYLNRQYRISNKVSILSLIRDKIRPQILENVLVIFLGILIPFISSKQMQTLGNT